MSRHGQDVTLLVLLNGHHDLVAFTLPPCADGKGWTRLIDTNLEAQDDATFAIGDSYQVTGRSLLVFALEAE